ncbi:MAG TPA: iron-sulfur cluster repair di-iron protein [Gaiellaceae bacterium]|nr:iron-sulfur cluster repair di-iron protein [Gaiellaceae bacterium]
MTIDPSRTVAELVLERPARARVLERLGLDYCCGGKRSLREACESRGLDVAETAAQLEAAAAEEGAEPDWTQVPLAELCDHIVAAHHDRLRDELPRLDALLEKVVRAHGAVQPDLADLRDTFRAMRAELEGHMAFEEEQTFPLCRTGGPFDPDQLAALEHDHEETGAALARLRELAKGYALDGALCNTHRATLDGLRELELDLHRHIHEENNVLFPRALAAA